MTEPQIVEVQAPTTFVNSMLNGCRAEVLRVANGVTHVRILDGEHQDIKWQLLSEHVRPIQGEPEWGWWASYVCGCISETVREKEALLGRVCPRHGALQKDVFGTEPPPESDTAGAVVERLEAAIRRYPVNRDLLQCSLSAIQALQAERDILAEDLNRNTAGTWLRSIAKRDRVNADLRAEKERLQEACEFYADPETWGPSADGIYVQSPLGRDRGTAADGSDCPGAKARKALGQERI